MDAECCASCEVGLETEKDIASTTRSTNTTTPLQSLRILTWAQTAPTLQAYADLYRQQYPQEPIIRVISVPSFKELSSEVNFEFNRPTGVYDGFVVPSMLVGDMYQRHGGTGLAVWNDRDVVNDLLPFYKYQVASYDGAIRSLPLFAGSQLLLLFRKDYLDAKNLTAPKTWSDWAGIAAALHNETLGADGQPIYGSCLGRLSQEACRRMDDLSNPTSSPCQSQSMSYLGMMLASMTQAQGNSTGWMLGTNETSPTGLNVLFQPTLETILEFMEQQLTYGAPNQQFEDASINLRLFREGLCAMTVTSDHDPTLLNRSEVGFVPLPGHNQYLVRGEERMENCTNATCPYGVDDPEWGRVNMVPFAATDAAVGAVSAQVSLQRQNQAKDFFQFCMFIKEMNATYFRYQPLTFSDLQKSTVPGYQALMESLTNSPNAATPFQIPNAQNLLTDLDNRVYQYLVDGDYTTAKREQVSKSAERSWQSMIRMYDARDLGLSTVMFHAKSIGNFVPESAASNLYIGWISRGIGWGLAGISCVASIVLALWVLKNRNERVVRASQPIFLLMVCLGTLVMSASIFPFGIEDDIISDRGCSIACMAGLWCFCIGFVITFSVLFSKIWLVRSVLRQSLETKQRIKMTRRDIVLPNLLLYTINVVALLVWTLTNPQTWSRIPVDDEATIRVSSSSSSSSMQQSLMEVSTRGWCGSSQTTMYLGIMVGTNLVMMAVSLIQAYECRKITTEHSESMWISNTIAVIAQVWVVGLPILRLLDDNPQNVFLTKFGIICVSSYTTLALIFGPKMSYQRTVMVEKKYQQQVICARRGVRKQSQSSSSSEAAEEESSKTQSHDDEEFSDLQSEEETNQNNNDTMGTHNGTQRRRRRREKEEEEEEPLGIRIIPASFVHSEEADKLQMAVDNAEQRNRSLQSTLETLQEKMEQYIIARDPLNGLYHPNPTSLGATTGCGPAVIVTDSSNHHNHHHHNSTDRRRWSAQR